MYPYVAESFSDDEREVLRHYVTNLDGPVFALVNMPEVVKGALFARYSRSSKSLRRLLLDEFADDLDPTAGRPGAPTSGSRADELYQRVFVEYGDDSVAQLGGVHLACEQSSNVLTKVLEHGRLMSYLEQSTRYLAYDRRLSTGHYRYYRDPAILESRWGARYVGELDRMFDTYARLLPALTSWLGTRFPKTADDDDIVYRQALRAKALDAVRGLLPAAALSNLGIYGSGQSYELLLLRMRAHPLGEVREYAELMRAELDKVIPSFLRRLDVPERGGAWVDYLRSRDLDVAERLAAVPEVEESFERVRLVDHDPDGERRILEAIVFEHAGVSSAAASRYVVALAEGERDELWRAYVGPRSNRRHRPGRAFEHTTYRFELVTDYGAFRDLQRHRMATIVWQPLGPDLGYEVPDLVDESGLGGDYRASLERSGDLAHALASDLPEAAPYAVALAFRIRYTIEMNAREALHLIELRSSPQGHPSYRRVAHEMIRQIRAAGHRRVADAMSFVDYGDVDLERLEAERRAHEARSRAHPS